MIRYYYIIGISIFSIIYYIFLMEHYAKHPEKYTELAGYRLVQKIINIIKKRGRIQTDVYGKETLPKDGGYIMYANHQGKYDACGILYAHDEPFSIVIDSVTASKILCDQVIKLLRGARFVKGDLKQQGKEIIRIIKEVKEGKKWLIFPEAGYVDNKNELIEFHAGSFKMALKAKCPIVPVALIDSYKPFSLPTLRRVRTQVHFLEPIMYEEYKDMNTIEISEMVKERIRERIAVYAEDAAVNAEKIPSKEEDTSLIKHHFLGVYNYTVLLAYFSLAIGVFGLFMANRSNVPSAMACLMVAAFIEHFDRKIAHKQKKWSSDERHYSIHVDSLNDLLCFGVLPCSIGSAVGLNSFIHILFYVFYIGSVVIRLSYLNVKAEKNEISDKYCQGLPVTSIVVLLFALYLFKDIIGGVYDLIMTCIYPVAGIAYISSFRIRRPKALENSEQMLEAEESVKVENSGQ